MHTLKLRCAAGHEQTIRFDERGFNEDMVHDMGAMLAGGTLRSIGVSMPGQTDGCAWSEDGAPRCGARMTFEIGKE